MIVDQVHAIINCYDITSVKLAHVHLYYVLCIFSHSVVCFLEIFYFMLLCFVAESL